MIAWPTSLEKRWLCGWRPFFFPRYITNPQRMASMTKLLRQSNGIEISCWVVSGIIVIGLILTLINEIMRPFRPPAQDADKDRRRRAHESTPPDTGHHGHHDSTVAAGRASARQASPTTQDDDQEVQENIVDQEPFFPSIDKKKAMQAANTLPAHEALSDTGNPSSAPSRVIGASQIAWMALHEPKPLPIGSETIPFGSSSHLEGLRAGLL